MRPLTVIVALLTLAACGADGPPERPEPKSETGVIVSGTVKVGVSGTL